MKRLFCLFDRQKCDSIIILNRPSHRWQVAISAYISRIAESIIFGDGDVAHYYYFDSQ